MAHKPDTDYDSTVVQFSEDAGPKPLPFAPVAVAQGGSASRGAEYVAQQTSFDDFTGGLNPLINAASFLVLEIISLKAGKLVDIEELRHRLEAEVRSFTHQVQTLKLRESQWYAARYLLCTALDESVASSNLPKAGAEWASGSLLSTFHEETQGGEVFFQVLERIMKQPAANLYLLELAYLLLSLGFEGKYRMRDRGSLELESQRDSLYRQIRVLRGEAGLDLSKKIDQRAFKSRTYAYVPLWLIGIVVVFCLAVTFWGFSFALDNKADPLLAQYSAHAPKTAPYMEPAGYQSEKSSESHNSGADAAGEARQ